MASAVAVLHSPLYAVAGSVVLIYEFLITLDQEVSVMWRKHSQASPWLFFLNRYSTLFYVILTLTPTGFMVSNLCQPGVIVLSALLVIQFATSSVFTSLRAYCMSGRNLPLACVVFAVSLVPMTVDVYTNATMHIKTEPACMSMSTVPRLLQFRLIIASRIGMILLDALVLFLTWKSTWTVYIEAKAINMKSPLVTLLIRDGTSYFLGVLLIHALRLSDISLGENTWFTSLGPFWATLSQSSTFVSLLMSRFLLNLRQVVYQDQVPNSQSHFSAVGFCIPDGIVGNLGEPLEYGPSKEESEKEHTDILTGGTDGTIASEDLEHGPR